MNFKLEYQVLSDICKCVDKMSDNKHVFFRQDSESFRIYAKSTEFYVDYVIGPVTDGEFGFGIGSEQFISIVKKLEKKKDVSFDIGKSKLTIIQGETQAWLPMTDKIIDFSRLSYLPSFDVPGFLSDVEFCAKSIKEDKRYKGILVNCANDYTKVAKLGFASCCVCTGNAYQFVPQRFVLSTEAALAIKSLDSKSKQSVLLNDNVFGVGLSSGVTFYSMLVYDKYPENFFSMFGEPDGPCFQVNRKELVDILTTIHSVMGTDETGVTWERQSTDPLVWRLSCKTYKGVEVSENITALETSSAPESFGLHRKALLDILKAMDKRETLVTVYPSNGSYLYVCAGRHVAALTKVAD